MALQEKQIGQARENSTNNVSVYSPDTGVTAIIKGIFVANTSGADATVRIFIDDNGVSYTEATAIVWDVTVPADGLLEIDTFIAMDNAAGNIAYRSSVANALTITIFGAEIT